MNWQTISTSDSTWNDSGSTWNDSGSNWSTYKITYYDPMEYQQAQYVPADAPIADPNPKKKKVKKTTDDPLDWLNQRVAEITELVEL